MLNRPARCQLTSSAQCCPAPTAACRGAREPVGSTLAHEGQLEGGCLLGVLSRDGTVLWVERWWIAKDTPSPAGRGLSQLPKNLGSGLCHQHTSLSLSANTRPAEGEMTQQCSAHNCPYWGCCTAWEPGGAAQPIWPCSSHAGLPREPPARSPPPQPARALGFEVGGIMRELII